MTHSPYEPLESIPLEELNAAHATRMRTRAALTLLIFLVFVIIGVAATYYYSAKTFPTQPCAPTFLSIRATSLGARPIAEPVFLPLSQCIILELVLVYAFTQPDDSGVAGARVSLPETLEDARGATTAADAVPDRRRLWSRRCMHLYR
jgi:hypothetical protein